MRLNSTLACCNAAINQFNTRTIAHGFVPHTRSTHACTCPHTHTRMHTYIINVEIYIYLRSAEFVTVIKCENCVKPNVNREEHRKCKKRLMATEHTID